MIVGVTGPRTSRLASAASRVIDAEGAWHLPVVSQWRVAAMAPLG